MAYDVTIKEEPGELVASIRRRIASEQIGEMIPEAFGRLMGCVEEVGYGHGMPGIVLHEIREPASVDVEVCMPVAASFDPPEGVQVRVLPGGTMAAVLHTGPYDASQPAYDALTAWVTEHGWKAVGPPREHYLNDPHVVGIDHAETEIEIPVARVA